MGVGGSWMGLSMADLLALFPVSYKTMFAAALYAVHVCHDYRVFGERKELVAFNISI
jgi:hypothetical protein